MFGLGHFELIAILFVIILVFGGKKIPEIAKGLGKGIREFKDAHSGKSDNPESTGNQTPPSVESGQPPHDKKEPQS